MTAHSVSFDVIGWGPQPGFGTAEVVHFGFGRRLARSLGTLALVWVIAVPLLFIPYAIVVVLPAALALSVYFVAQHMQAPNVATTCSGTCPDCGRSQQFDIPERFELPIEIQCANCHRELWLRSHRGPNIAP